MTSVGVDDRNKSRCGHPALLGSLDQSFPELIFKSHACPAASNIDSALHHWFLGSSWQYHGFAPEAGSMVDNVTETARMLGVTRQTIHWYIRQYPELQQHRRDVIAMVCDKARSNVYEDVVVEKNVRTSMTVLEKNDPAWRNKQTIEHTGTVGVVPGLMSKDEIRQLSNDDLQKMRTVRKIELAALKAETVNMGADDVRGGETTGDRTA
jgi:hypothetical protein